MSERCEIQVAGLPIVDSCPPDDALFFANNVPDGLGEFGYAQFTWLIIKNCILAAASNPFIPKYFQFITVGDELTYEITPPENYIVVEDSVNISMDGAELCRYTDETAVFEKIMYTVVYEDDVLSEDYGKAILNFFNAGAPIPAGQVIIIKYGIRAN